ncbi:MAG: helix-turn-helix transcriptional regulator [Paracoccaceae bacterium]
MPITERKQLLNIKDVSMALNISTATIWRHVKAGTFPEPVAIGRLKRWRRSDIEAIFAAASQQ